MRTRKICSIIGKSCHLIGVSRIEPYDWARGAPGSISGRTDDGGCFRSAARATSLARMPGEGSCCEEHSAGGALFLACAFLFGLQTLAVLPLPEGCAS